MAIQPRPVSGYIVATNTLIKYSDTATDHGRRGISFVFKKMESEELRRTQWRDISRYNETALYSHDAKMAILFVKEDVIPRSSEKYKKMIEVVKNFYEHTPDELGLQDWYGTENGTILLEFLLNGTSQTTHCSPIGSWTLVNEPEKYSVVSFGIRPGAMEINVAPRDYGELRIHIRANTSDKTEIGRMKNTHGTAVLDLVCKSDLVAELLRGNYRMALISYRFEDIN